MRNRHGFIKSERIVSQKLIDELFTGGQSHSLTAFPLRAVYLLTQQKPSAEAVAATSTSAPIITTNAHPTEAKPVAQLLLSVPKRRFHHAVDRNRVKRQLREAYRTSRHMLTDHVPADKQVALAFIWMADKHFPSADVAQRVQQLLRRIAKQITVAIPLNDDENPKV